MHPCGYCAKVNSCAELFGLRSGGMLSICAMSKHLLLAGRGAAATQPPAGFALGEGWEIREAPTAYAAVEILQQNPIDVLVVDAYQGENSGAALLDKIERRFPQARGFILADLADSKALKCVGAAHPLLASPCDQVVLQEALNRAGIMEVLFSNAAVKNLAHTFKKMPSPPSSYFQVLREVQSPDSSMARIGELISQDLALTAKLLQMVNSARYGLQQKVSNAGEAVMYLGLETTKALVILAHTFSYFEDANVGDFSVEGLWEHSLGTARLARAIAQSENADADVRDEAFTAGLLHDIGKLLMAANEPAKFQEAQATAIVQELPEWETERELFGATHAELGAWMMAIWGLPLNIVEAILLHHSPAKLLNQGFCALTAVHAANVAWLVHRGSQVNISTIRLDETYLDSLGLMDRIKSWHQLKDD
jgi:putative nucleotidyltransferase with HDIG domain